jgi:S-layer protein
MAKRIKKQSKTALKLEALETRQLLAGVTGAGTEVTPGGTGVQGDVAHFIQHPNGNKYDQVLLTGGSVSVTNDPGQITRVSFLDAQGDIVQAEFSGAGTFTVSMADGYSTGVAPTKYNQTGVTYVQGNASITVSGSDATTNVNLFSVGSGTAFSGNTLFDSTHTGGDHFADIQRLTVVADVQNPNGSTFGSIFAGDVHFSGSSGVVGVAAANVQVQGVVRVGDIDASSTATPTLTFGTASQFGSVDVTGGDLVQTNGKSINNTGSYNYGLNLIAGTDAANNAIAAQPVSSSLTFSGSNPITAATKTFNLTSSVDSVVGTAGNDVINGTTGTNATLTALDSIDGGAGTDTLNVSDVSGNSGLPVGISIKNVEVLNLASAGKATIDTSVSTISGLTTVNVVQSTGDETITASSSQAVTVFDSAGTVTVTGGASQSVTTKGGVVLSGSTGAITATDSGQGAVASTIDGGSTVTLTTTSVPAAGNSGAVTIGGTTAPTGAVGVTYTLTGDKTTDSGAAPGAISVKGGSTVNVALSASQPVNTTGTNYTLTLPAIGVTGTSATTSVTVSGEVAAVTAVTGVAKVDAVAGTTESNVVKFADLTAGQTLTIAGLTYTAPSTGAKAAQVASSFANLAKGSGIVGWTTGAVSGSGSDTLTFTSQTASSNVADLAITGSGAVASNTKTDGVAGTASTSATSAKAGIVTGGITINDANTTASNATITTVSLNNYAGGATINSGALANLTLGGDAGAVTIGNTASKTLSLTLTGTKPTTLTAPTYTTINAHLSGDSTITTLTATSATALTVDGTKTLTLTNPAATLKTVTVSGSAGLNSDLSATAVTDVNASGTTGANTVTLAAGVTFEGGAGVDTVTLTAAPTAAIDGGSGTDVLVVNAASYANSTKVTNFETLAAGAAANGTFDATGFTGLSIGGTTGATTFSNVAAGTQLTFTGGPTGVTTYTLKDGSGTSDSVTLNLANSGGATNAGTVTVNAAVGTDGVETININSAGKASNTNSITLGTDPTLTTIKVTGSNSLTLTNALNTGVTTVDASALSGVLTYTTAGTVAETVTGGSKDDVLTAGTAGSTQADVLIGGAGNDTLKSNAGLTTLTGGTGADTFVIRSAGANVNTYTTVDATTGDFITLLDQGAETFKPNKITLGTDTAVFQDYANAAVTGAGNVSTDGNISWFQFNGNTYIVESMGHTANTSFTNGTDVVVKITGLVDLSNALLTSAAGVPTLVIR